MEIHSSQLPELAAHRLLDVIAPGSALVSIRPLTGDFANRQFYLDAVLPSGAPLCMVVKLYQGDYDYCVKRARTEYQTLQWLHAHRRPAPEPLFLDDSSVLFGGPGIATRFLPGRPVASPPYPPGWGAQMARTLASIHAYPCDPAAQPFLLDANREALWFRKKGAMPAWLAQDPDGPSIWQAVEALLPHVQPAAPRLVHLDFWGGNVLVHEDKITAVVDWEEAAIGDPSVDVAYALMDLVLCGLEHDADAFMRTYEAETGEPVANLTLWKLAAAARPIHIPVGYIDYSPVRERFRAFVQQALQEAARARLL